MAQEAQRALKRRRVAYLASDDLDKAADALPSNLGRASFVSRLIRSVPALLDVLDTVEPQPAGSKELHAFHDADLVSHLLHQKDEEEPARKKGRFSLLEFDCPDFDELPKYVMLVAGASITGARLLRERKADVAISWNGGRHHAFSDKPSGYCYVNDIALGIFELRKPTKQGRLDRVIYLDLDVHAGDGVQEAFYSSASVLTLSIHHQAPGFFPTAGPLDETGPEEPSKAAFHTLNLAIPKPGCSDASLERLFSSCVESVKAAFKPHAVVVCLGVDGLAGDPVAAFNYSLSGMLRALERVLAWDLPTLLLGGGGYESTQCARAWTAATMLVAGLGSVEEIARTAITDECEDFPDYAPAYTLDVPAGSRSEENKEQDLQRIEHTFAMYARKLRAQYAE